ncbi:hypothetical protein ACJMK2_035098 [Sinanodonta woodiana]|uniref:rhomboid protease n=1 Tax=Sinanodonta woodiana TaxID=1069815 RepID=A0ABD3WV25_SINWO
MAVARNPDLDRIYLQSIAAQQADYDLHSQGQLTLPTLRDLMADPELWGSVDNHMMEVLEMKCITNIPQVLSYQEFINIMSNRRSPSFRLAVESPDKATILSVSNCICQRDTQHSSSCFDKMVRKIARKYLTDDIDRQYYEDQYTCCPPPLFVPIITFVEVGFFIYHCLDMGRITLNGPVPVNSVFIYRPDRRIEVWRFILYMFIHAGWIHLFFNMLIQILVGLPLEMVHGSCRIATVYMAGVLAGSLGTSIFDMHAYLVGASGGVYALLAGHLANILLNYSHMQLGIVKLAAVLLIASSDVGFAIWDRYSKKTPVPPISYTAHLMGALAGLTIGLVVLKNFEQKLHEQYMWWTALTFYLGWLVFAILWNIFYY